MNWFDDAKKYVGWPFGKGKDPSALPQAPTQHVPSVVTLPNPPPVTQKLKPLVSNDERAVIFGRFAYEAEPMPGNEENIRVTDDWQKENIVWVPISQLKGVSGVEQQGGKFPKPPGMLFHRKAAKQLVGLWWAWEQAGLLPLIKEFDGSYSPRFVRGSDHTLSNHAFGGAFDINYAWNHLGAEPSPIGAHGTVRPLVPIAAAYGFFWGGNYSTRKDGMHFEIAKIL